MSRCVKYSTRTGLFCLAGSNNFIQTDTTVIRVYAQQMGAEAQTSVTGHARVLIESKKLVLFMARALNLCSKACIL